MPHPDSFPFCKTVLNLSFYMLKSLVFKPYKDSLLLKDLRTDGATSDAATGGWGGGGCTFNPKDSGSSFPYNEALLLSF